MASASDIISNINSNEAFVERMQKSGFELIDIPYSKVTDFMEQKKEEYYEGASSLGIVE